MKSINPVTKRRLYYTYDIEKFDCESIAPVLIGNYKKLILTPVNGLFKQGVLCHCMKLPESRFTLSQPALQNSVELTTLNTCYLAAGVLQKGVGKNVLPNSGAT